MGQSSSASTDNHVSQQELIRGLGVCGDFDGTRIANGVSRFSTTIWLQRDCAPKCWALRAVLMPVG
jgi:hypothetical protein